MEPTHKIFRFARIEIFHKSKGNKLRWKIENLCLKRIFQENKKEFSKALILGLMGGNDEMENFYFSFSRIFFFFNLGT